MTGTQRKNGILGNDIVYNAPHNLRITSGLHVMIGKDNQPVTNKTMKHFILFLTVLTGLWPLTSAAQIKDSDYFMMDDGKMTPEEMEEEAMYVYEQCRSNSYKRKYYDCRCIAGAFLTNREKDGPARPQDDIVYNLFRGGPSECANTVSIAGDAYKDCMDTAKIFREFAKDNEEYCSCVGKTTANSFAKKPLSENRLY